VQTAGGETIGGLRMKSVSESGYRFIRQDGSECLMPSGQVRMIRVLVLADATDTTNEAEPGRVAEQGG
jgi:hypothetical protein